MVRSTELYVQFEELDGYERIAKLIIQLKSPSSGFEDQVFFFFSSFV